jgi:DHA2 family multidrug resistance protein-like MFS transporter
MTIAYTTTLTLPEAGAALPSIVRDSLDEALRVADGLPAAAADALRHDARAAFGNALRAVLGGVGLLWFVTGIAIAARGRRTKLESWSAR